MTEASRPNTGRCQKNESQVTHWNNRICSIRGYVQQQGQMPETMVSGKPAPATAELHTGSPV